MPIILAIEPDRRQRHALGAVVRQRVGAELILADTTEHALEAIGNRMPDLVLVPALLSPQDDAALAAALRVIAAAAHVRTLTIPVLANESKTEAKSGLLSRWRRGRNASPTPDGCDPHVFAEQISAYLAEAAAERAALQKDADEMVDAPVVEAPVVDPAILKAAIVEAVSLSSAVMNDTMVDRATAGQAFEDYALVNDTMLDRAFVDQTSIVHTIVEHDVVDRPAIDVAGDNTNGDRPRIDEATIEPTIVDRDPAVDYTAAAETIIEPAIADRAPIEQAADVATVDDEIVVDSPMLAPEKPAVVLPDLFAPRVALGAAQEHDAAAEARHDHAGSVADADADKDIDLSSEIADISLDDEAGTELFDDAQVGVYAMSGFDDSANGDRPVVEESAVAASAVEEAVVDQHVAEQIAVDEPVLDAAAAGVSLVEPLAIEEVEVDTFAADELVADELVLEEFSIGEVVDIEEPGAAEPVVTARTIEEPAVAPHVLEARAAFEQAEVMALTNADDAVLTEFADYAERDLDDSEAWISASLARPSTWPALEGVPAEMVIEPVKPEPVRPPAALTPHVRDVREREWTELVASLRQDIERRRVEPQVPKPKRPAKKIKPSQDEWGFFDPEQCGFAALLAKLDEITDSPDERDLPRH